jgi:hypothetical protein
MAGIATKMEKGVWLDEYFEVCVRVRWVDHKCKVNSDEFDREATLCS